MLNFDNQNKNRILVASSTKEVKLESTELVKVKGNILNKNNNLKKKLTYILLLYAQ